MQFRIALRGLRCGGMDRRDRTTAHWPVGKRDDNRVRIPRKRVPHRVGGVSCRQAKLELARARGGKPADRVLDAFAQGQAIDPAPALGVVVDKTERAETAQGISHRAFGQAQ